MVNINYLTPEQCTAILQICVDKKCQFHEGFGEFIKGFGLNIDEVNSYFLCNNDNLIYSPYQCKIILKYMVENNCLFKDAEDHFHKEWEKEIIALAEKHKEEKYP